MPPRVSSRMNPLFTLMYLALTLPLPLLTKHMHRSTLSSFNFSLYSGLERRGIQSATAHLQRIVEACKNGAEQKDQLPPLQITAPIHSRTLRPPIDRYLTEADIAIQCAWTSKTTNPRVFYGIFSLEHVQLLRDYTHTIDVLTYYASQYRFVLPLFAFELTVMRCRQFQSACSTNYIWRRYGDVIEQSRMTLDGELYCVVFKRWETADQFLRESFGAPSKSQFTYSIEVLGQLAQAGDANEDQSTVNRFLDDLRVFRRPTTEGMVVRQPSVKTETEKLSEKLFSLLQQWVSIFQRSHSPEKAFVPFISQLVKQGILKVEDIRRGSQPAFSPEFLAVVLRGTVRLTTRFHDGDTYLSRIAGETV
ncbi:hypothetical protein BDR06DRAFT_1015399 [Suillus hirtellus]|nr:hypothetical protein BDR06DRAFT_1015399 [Suillus hirtellus]